MNFEIGENSLSFDMPYFDKSFGKYPYFGIYEDDKFSEIVLFVASGEGLIVKSNQPESVGRFCHNYSILVDNDTMILENKFTKVSEDFSILLSNSAKE